MFERKKKSRLTQSPQVQAQAAPATEDEPANFSLQGEQCTDINEDDDDATLREDLRFIL